MPSVSYTRISRPVSQRSLYKEAARNQPKSSSILRTESTPPLFTLALEIGLTRMAKPPHAPLATVVTAWH